MRYSKWLAALAVTGAAALAACDDDGAVTPGDDEGQFTIVMQSEGSAAAALLAPGDVEGARVSLDAVESITLPIGDVEAHRIDGGAWVDAGSIDASVDLMALPEDGVTLLESSLEEGEYNMLRFWLDGEPTITLSEPVSVGRTEYEAGTHELVIPSSDQAGVRLRADFEVDDDGQALTVLFNGEATVRNVNATGAGTLKIAPQLRVENEDGDDVGGIDDEDDEEDPEVELNGQVASVTDTGFTLQDGTVVVIEDDTEIGGDLLSLAAVTEALEAEEVVEAQVEGVLDEDGTTVIASDVEFSVEADD